MRQSCSLCQQASAFGKWGSTEEPFTQHAAVNDRDSDQSDSSKIHFYEDLDQVPWDSSTSASWGAPAPSMSLLQPQAFSQTGTGTSRPGRAICKAWQGSESRAGGVGRGLEKAELVN